MCSEAIRPRSWPGRAVGITTGSYGAPGHSIVGGYGGVDLETWYVYVAMGDQDVRLHFAFRVECAFMCCGQVVIAVDCRPSGVGS
jgi:hypothetical protein